MNKSKVTLGAAFQRPIVAAVTGLLLLTGSMAKAEEPDSKPIFTAADVFQLRTVANPIVDNAGERVIYLRRSMDIMRDSARSNLWIIDVDGDNHRPLTTGEDNISGATLSLDDTRIAYVKSNGKSSQIYVQWLDSGQFVQLSSLPQSPGNLSWSPDGKWLAFTMFVPSAPPTMGSLPSKPEGAEWAAPPVVVERSIFRFDGLGPIPHGSEHVFVIPAEGGSARQITKDEFDYSGQLTWAKDGQSLFLSTNREPDWQQDVVDSEIYHIQLGSGEISKLTDRDGPDGSMQLSPNGKQLAYVGWDDQRKSVHFNRLYTMNVDGSDQKEIPLKLNGELLDRGIGSINWSDNGKSIYFQYDDRGKTLLAKTDLSGKVTVLADNLGGQVLGRPYTSGDYAVGGRDVLAFSSATATSPAELSVLAKGKTRQLTHLNDNLLQHRSMGQVEELVFPSSADQKEIQAWLVKPPNFDADKKYPLILEIHGGPHTAYGPQFSAEVQLFAAAGYAVLYVNPRGSTSYGEAFADLIDNNYPSQDYDDLMSAVDVAIEQGFIDTDQLYVTGGSGGGVLTAWIVGKTDRFRAAVVAKPVINWVSFVLTADLPPFFSRYWFDKMPWEDPMAYWKRSPLSLVGNVETPTMLLTGESDLRTPISETEQYYQALKLRGIDTAMVRIPGASHGIAGRPSRLIAKVNAILEWFKRYSPESEAEAED